MWRIEIWNITRIASASDKSKVKLSEVVVESLKRRRSNNLNNGDIEREKEF